MDTRKDIKINYKYACPIAKRSLWWNIFKSIAGNWKWKAHTFTQFQDVYNCLPEFCNLVTSKNYLVEKVFPNILTNHKNHKWLSERAVLAAKNKDVQEINNINLTKIRDQAAIYELVDTVLEWNEAVNYPSEFSNSLDVPEFPPARVTTKNRRTNNPVAKY